MQKKKTYWFIGISLLFLLATNVVFIRLYLQTPVGHHYTGNSLEAVADKFVYYSMIQQGAEGRLFMQNVYTSEPQLGLLFSPHWYAIGMTARLLSIPIAFSYHLYRWIGTLVFLFLLYPFVQKLFANAWSQIGAFATVLFSSGLGWLYFVAHPEIENPAAHWLLHFNQTPIDLYVTEFSAFTNTLQSPLFILSHCLILLVYLLFIREQRSLKLQLLLLCIIAIFGMIHPYDMILLLVVTGSLAATELMQRGIARTTSRLWPVLLGVSVAALYHSITFMMEPALSGWLSQNIAFSPSFSNYLWAMGIVAPLGIIGIVYLVRVRELRNPYWRLVLIWAIVIMVLMYLPISINRRFANTLLIPWSLLAWYGLMHLSAQLRKYLTRVTLIMVCALVLCSGVFYQIAQSIFYIPDLPEKYNYYIDPYMSDVLDTLHAQLNYTDVLLPSTEFIGILSAAYVPTRVYIGHEHQSTQYELKKGQMEWFFAEPQGDGALTQREHFLKEKGITTIIVYKPSMTTSYDWIDTLPGVTRVYDSIVARIFKVSL